MPKTLTAEDARKIATYIVQAWESIEPKAKEFKHRFNTTEEARAAFAHDMREMLGGEEVYLASKQFLACYTGDTTCISP